MILSDVSPQSDRKWNPDDSHKRIENFQRKLWRLVHDAIYLQKADNLPELSQEEFQKQVHKCWDARNYYLRVGIFLTWPEKKLCHSISGAELSLEGVLWVLSDP